MRKKPKTAVECAEVWWQKNAPIRLPDSPGVFYGYLKDYTRAAFMAGVRSGKEKRHEPSRHA
jgi:hypothetical protein